MASALMGSGVHFSSASVEWATPWPLFNGLDAEFHFTVDVCANADNAKCARFFTVETDGLSEDWSREICWMNPPYGRVIGAWMKKAYESSRGGATVVCLVPARTDTKWWHDYAMKGEIRFLKGRVYFEQGNGARSPAPFPSAIVIFRATPTQFPTR